MGNNLDRYQQSPTEFRKQIRQKFTKVTLWLSDGNKGGEVGRAIMGYFKRRPQKQARMPFNRIEQQLQKIPTWLFVSGAVLLLSGIALWVEDEIEIKSIQDVIKVVFENAESIAIAAVVILYFKEIPDRKEQKHYEAWQVIDNAAAAKISTSYARHKALEDLNRDGVSLWGVDIPEADLKVIDLQNADLLGADLQGANFWGGKLMFANLNEANLKETKLMFANLQEASFQEANLKGAKLVSANLQQAKLVLANLQEADLQGADLQGAKLLLANLQRANLLRANLQGADLSKANLKEAKLILSNLQGANFQEADLQGADLQWTNLQEALNLNQEQLTFAKLCQTKLPAGINLDPNRDCQTE